MKIPAYLSPRRSVYARLVWGVGLTTLGIFAILTFVITDITTTVMRSMSSQNAQSRMEIANQKVNSYFMEVEVAIHNVIPEVEKVISTPDKIYDVLKTLLELNPHIIGSAVAFEPYYYPAKGEMFSPYAYMKGDTILTKQLGTSEYNYFEMEWYLIPKQRSDECWSHPYFDKGGGEQMMTTFSCPLYDVNHQLYAIITADVSLDWLTEMMKKSDIEFNEWLLHEHQNEKDFNTSDDFLYKHAYSFIVGQHGTYITHPDKKRILNSSYFDNCTDTTDTRDRQIGLDMLDGNKGIGKLSRDGTDFFMAYAPIERTGWAMATVIPARAINRVATFIGLIIMGTMLLGVFILYFVCRTILVQIVRPLKRLSRSADEIAQGNFEAPLPEITAKDEVGNLYHSFKTMQTSLTERIEELKVANEQKGRIEGELQTARNIQMAMLPKTFPAFPDRTDMDIYAKLTPAKEVGGDLYDFFIRSEKLYFCIGDVTGKGVPASLLMAVTRSLFRSMASREDSPAKLTSMINDTIAEENSELMFVTLFIAVLDLPTGHLNYCNAGHCQPVILDTAPTLLPVEPNIPVGITTGYKYVEQETTLTPGMSLFLYSDGITEAENARHELFGNDRAMDVLKRCIEDNDDMPEKIISRMEEAIYDFVKEANQSDDQTMMAVRYTKENEETKLERSLTLPNDIETIPQLSEFIEGIGEELGMGLDMVMSLNLALEEAVVNVMEYAYPKNTKGEVCIQAIANDKRLKIIISDSGIPFDPTKKEKVDTTLSAEERPIGGLGIHLVREIMDSVNYKYTDRKNILTLRKNLK